MPVDAIQDLLRRYFDALERKDTEALSACLHPEIEQIELPNALVRAGARRDHEALLEGLRRGAAVLQQEHYELRELLVDGDRAAARVRWTAILAVPVLGKAAGEPLSAEFGLFFHVEGGRVRRQWNYDCFEV